MIVVIEKSFYNLPFRSHRLVHKTSIKMKINAIITGVTGMVGEGVLHECLLHPDVEKVLVIGRRSCGVTHSKLQEVLHGDFNNFDALKHTFSEYNACFFCLGVSSVGMKEDKYSRITYDLTISLANAIYSVRPDATFCYVSGTGTDSTEKGKSTQINDQI